MRDELMVRIRAEAAVGPTGLDKQMRRRRASHEAKLAHYREIEARDFTPQRLGTRAARIHHMILKKGILYEQGSIAWGEEMLPVLDGGIAV